MSLKDLPADARPREKLLARGPGALSDADFGPETYGVHLSASNVQKVLARDFGGVIPDDSFLGHHVTRAKVAGVF